MYIYGSFCAEIPYPDPGLRVEDSYFGHFARNRRCFVLSGVSAAQGRKFLVAKFLVTRKGCTFEGRRKKSHFLLARSLAAFFAILPLCEHLFVFCYFSVNFGLLLRQFSVTFL